MKFAYLLLVALTPAALGASLMQSPNGVERARELKDFLRKEKPRFEKRESQKHDIMGQLDRLNSEQNQVREKISGIEGSRQELAMAVDNLALEMENQKKEENLQKKRLVLLLKVVYKVRKDGLLRFIVTGDSVSAVTQRIRILLHTLRSHSAITRQLEDRAARLAVTEQKATEAGGRLQKILSELKDQEDILNDLLAEKRQMLQALDQKQSYFHAAQREYRAVSRQLASLFDNFESARDAETSEFPNRGTLPLPIQFGHVVQNFGKSVNERFHTVIYHKGIEIEADHNTPVTAVMSGTIEYDGWVKGLGNVLILHHGGGFYSLSAHLFKTLKNKGSHVEQGETIGYVGDTGSDDKPSLYFELRENGRAVDPVTYFSPKALASLR